MANQSGTVPPFSTSMVDYVAEEVIRDLETAQQSVPTGARFTRTLRVECVANTLRGFIRVAVCRNCANTGIAPDGVSRCTECKSWERNRAELAKP